MWHYAAVELHVFEALVYLSYALVDGGLVVVGFVLVVYHPPQLFEEVLCLTFERLCVCVCVREREGRCVSAHSSMQNQTIHACDYKVGHTHSSVVWECKK